MNRIVEKLNQVNKEIIKLRFEKAKYVALLNEVNVEFYVDELLIACKNAGDRAYSTTDIYNRRPDKAIFYYSLPREKMVEESLTFIEECKYALQPNSIIEEVEKY